MGVTRQRPNRLVVRSCYSVRSNTTLSRSMRVRDPTTARRRKVPRVVTPAPDVTATPPALPDQCRGPHAPMTPGPAGGPAVSLTRALERRPGHERAVPRTGGDGAASPRPAPTRPIRPGGVGR